MTMHAQKRAYVRTRLRTAANGHHCHWPGCNRTVPAAQWGCYPHWMALPKYLRDKIWAAFRPGQEITKTPSQDYVVVAREVQDWIEANKR